MVKEYLCIKVKKNPEEFKKELNDLAKKGWRVVCSYDLYNKHLVLEREIDKFSLFKDTEDKAW